MITLKPSFFNVDGIRRMEWNTGFEPVMSAWKAEVLPLHQSHINALRFQLATEKQQRFDYLGYVESATTDFAIKSLLVFVID